jgi:hypothetical protein
MSHLRGKNLVVSALHVQGRLFNAVGRHVRQESLVRKDKSQSPASRPYGMGRRLW